MQGNLSVERMCQLAGVSRAGLYRSLQKNEPVEEEKVFGGWPGVGLRRAKNQSRLRAETSTSISFANSDSPLSNSWTSPV